MYLKSSLCIHVGIVWCVLSYIQLYHSRIQVYPVISYCIKSLYQVASACARGIWGAVFGRPLTPGRPGRCAPSRGCWRRPPSSAARPRRSGRFLPARRGRVPGAWDWAWAWALVLVLGLGPGPGLGPAPEPGPGPEPEPGPGPGPKPRPRPGLAWLGWLCVWFAVRLAGCKQQWHQDLCRSIRAVFPSFGS